jgi:hypothetical protein
VEAAQRRPAWQFTVHSLADAALDRLRGGVVALATREVPTAPSDLALIVFETTAAFGALGGL